jgi:alpha-mannosidase
MVFAGQSALHLRLSVVWGEAQRLLRLRLAAPAKLDRRIDLVSGGPLARPLDSQEYPLNGALVVGDTARQDRPCHTMAVIAPEVFSVSADAEGVSLTLLRSPYVAHHDPYPAANRPDHPLTDQGLHEFDIILAPGAALDLAEPARLARQMLMPPVTWDLTG